MVTLDPTDEQLLAAIPEDDRARNGVPTAEQMASRERAAAAASVVLGPYLAPDGLRVSPLGAGWSSDIDAHLARPVSDVDLLAAGWIPLERLGYPGRWAVVVDGEVVGGCDLVRSPRPDAVQSVLDRARRRGEVRLREVLELRQLLRAGATLPDDPVVDAAVAAEAWLGGHDLAAPGSLSGQRPPVRLAGERPVAAMVTGKGRGLAREISRRVSRPPRSIGLSGVDGSGKSSLCHGLADALATAGVPSTTVWARPGMRIGPLERLARVGRRATGGGDEPGVRRVAGGAEGLPSRKGFVGTVWATLIGLMFVVDVRRQTAKARGVVLFDRHLPDAMVTLDFVYGGANLAVAKALARLALPRVGTAVYVGVPAEVATARKPGDSFGEHAVRRQLDLYATALTPAVHQLDGERPPAELVIDALRLAAGIPVAGRT